MFWVRTSEAATSDSSAIWTTRSTVSGLRPCPVRMIATSSEMTSAALVTASVGPEMVICCPRTWRSASSFASSMRRFSSPGPSRLIMSMDGGTFTTRLPGSSWS